MTSQRAALLATIAGAIILFQHGAATSPSELDVLVIRRFLGELVIPGELYIEALSHGPYFLVDHILASLLRLTGLAAHWQEVLTALKVASCWLAMIPLHSLMKRLTKSETGAALGVLFFAADLTFFPIGTGAMLNRRVTHFLVLPPVFWSLDMFLARRKGWANFWAAVGVCMHVTPAIYLVPLYFLEDLYQICRKEERLDWAFWGRWTGLLGFCAAFIGFVGGGSHPPPLDDSYLAGVRCYSGQISLRIAANKGDLINTFVGALWFIAVGGFSTLENKGVLARLTVLTALGCVASTLVEAVQPAPWLMPFWSLTVKVCWLRALWLVNLFAIAAAAAKVSSLEDDKRVPFAATLLVCAALFLSRDYAARAAGLAALLFPALGVWALAAWTGASLLWTLGKHSLLPLAMKLLPFKGGIFQLPSFQPHFFLLLLAAGAAAVAGTKLRGRLARGGLIVLVSLTTLFVLDQDGFYAKAWAFPEWKQAAAFIREKTPPEALWLTPLSQDPFPFMADARRPVYAVQEFYGVIFAAFGHSAALAEHLRRCGVDFSRNRTYWDVFGELDRADRALTAGMMKDIAKEAPSAYALRPASQPLEDFPEVYRNAAYVIYRVR